MCMLILEVDYFYLRILCFCILSFDLFFFFQGFTQSSRPETREATGRLLGYLCSLLPPDQYLSTLRTTLEDVQSLV